jgi:hypothetical protein
MNELVLQENIPERLVGGIIVATEFKSAAEGDTADAATLSISASGKEEELDVTVGDRVEFGGTAWQVTEIRPVRYSGSLDDEASMLNPQSTLTLHKVVDEPAGQS